MTEASQVNVLVISGSGRSGSTLMLQILGSLDGYCAIGELNNIWEQSLLNNRPCSCGKAFRDCQFWNDVMVDAFGGPDRIDAKAMLALRDSTVRGKQLPLMAFPRLRTASFQQRVDEYAGVLESIYRSVQRVSGCDVIVDSSKGAGHAFMLAEMRSIRPRMIHLVRDSRATSYSWSRRKRRTDVLDREVYMEKMNHRTVALHWNVGHTFAPIAARRLAASTVCRYEDFANQPRATIEEILTDLGMSAVPMSPFVSDHSVCLRDTHALWGNPDRSNHGVVAIRPDSEWRRQMSVWKKAEVSLLTLPWLIKYRYLRRHAL
jgi:hypothetical protein